VSPVRPPRGEHDKILIEDLRFFGHHGVNPAEQELGGWFSTDVELSLDLTPAALSDDVGATVDYSEVARLVVRIGTEERVRLLERLAHLLVQALLREFPAREVRVRVRKLAPRLGGAPGVVGVELRRSR